MAELRGLPPVSAPGIYVQEVAGGARPIEAVGTSTAGFVGIAPLARARLGEAVAIGNWSEFVAAFVGDERQGTPLATAVRGFFDNGGSYCYVVNLGAGGTLTAPAGQRSGLDLLEQKDDVAIVAAPGFFDAESYDALRTHCETLKDRVAILDPPPEVAAIDALTRTSGALDGSGGEDDDAAAAAEGVRPGDSSYAALYFPWLRVRDPVSGELVSAPPSGHMAGIWARTDARRGVFKAPANEPVRGALGLAHAVTRAEQDLLNRVGVNCIRRFPREGIVVWGARTLETGDPAWRYLNVRRLLVMIEESIAEGTRWIVFEPNDETLWKSIRRDIGAFLERQWRAGALMGRTADEAFFVKCDAETNPPSVVDAGMVVTVVGVAPVKPAEYVVFLVRQIESGSDVEGAAR